MHNGNWETSNPMANNNRINTTCDQEWTVCSLPFAHRDKPQEENEIKCQRGIYPIDQLDSSGSGVPPSVSDRGFADGDRVRCNVKGAFFFPRRGKTRNRGRSFGGPVGCGAARSRSHGLSLSLP